MEHKIFILIVLAFFSLFPIPSTHADDEITIGWIGPLTGPSAVLGVDSVEVARQRFDEVNSKGGISGRKIRFIPEDDQYTIAKTVTAYNRLVKVENARIIIVLTYGGLKAIAAKAAQDNVLLLDTLDCDDELAALPQNVFCIAKRTEDLGIRNAQNAIKNHEQPAAIIYFDGDPFPVKVAKATKKTILDAGSKVVLFEGIPSGSTTDFRSLLVKARQEKVKSLFVYGYDDFGLAFKQAQELGLNCTFYSVPGGSLGSPGFDKSAGGAISRVVTSGWFAPKTARYQEFRESYKTQIGRYPFLDVATVPTYDIAQLLVSGIEKSLPEKGSLSIAGLQSYLYGVQNYDGLSGTISIDADGGVRTFKVAMYSYKNGSFELAEIQ